jgi:spore coat protein U-like protein
MIARTLLAIVLLALGLFAPKAAQAQAWSCDVEAVPTIDFGRPGVNPTAQVDVVGNLRVTCEGWYNADVKVCVGVAAGTDNAIAPRLMAATGNRRLQYQLYSDASRTQVIAPLSGSGAANPIEVPLTLNQQIFFVFGRGTVTIPVYGRLVAGQSGLGAGTYQSTMTSQVSSVSSAGTCRGATSSLSSFTTIARATLQGTCTVVANDLPFGVHAGLATTIDAQTQIALNCSTGTLYTVRLNGGSIAGNVADRRMGLNGSPPGVIAYQLHTDPDRTQVWGDGTLGTVVVKGTGTGGPQTLQVYGRVPNQATPAAGTYRDVVTATVEY